MKKILDIIDDFLNELTMYRLLVYGLLLIAAIAIAFSATGRLTISTSDLIIDLGLLSAVCYLVDRVLAKIWQAVPNQESWLITALILFFILPPALSATTAAAIAITGFVAIASKYIVARHNKHLFNPAAFGAAVIGLTGLLHASWWVGNTAMWPYVLIFGLLVVRKIRHFSLLLSFVGVTLVVTFISFAMQGQHIGPNIKPVLLASPLIFLGTIMLTEPYTMPARRFQQMIFGGLVGALYGFHPQVLGFYVYPETALVLGNIYAYAVNPKLKLKLVLKEVQPMSDRVSNYIFESPKKLDFVPGQYMDWTLPGVVFDGRGNRRTFTIASAPSENEIMLGAKFYEPSSAYKKKLRSLKPGETVVTGQIAGNFILPNDQSQKLLFIAGGIGITPFRSMLKYLIDTEQKRDTTVIYLVSNPREVSYRDVLDQAADKGMKIIPILTAPSTEAWEGVQGQLNEEVLAQYVPDLSERKAYISGPQVMVTQTKRLLQKTGVKRAKIVSDYFSGY
jgi:ferredoxin-NADP reductase